MARRLISVLQILSLMLAADVAVFWVRSFWFEQAICYRSDSQQRYVISSQRGSIWLEIIDEGQHDWDPGIWVYSTPRTIRDLASEDWYIGEYTLRRWGFALVRGARFIPVPPPPGSDLIGVIDLFPATAVAIPQWLTISLLALPPLMMLRRRCRRNANLCLTCGYDLRATPDRCPECGTPIPMNTGHRSEGETP